VNLLVRVRYPVVARRTGQRGQMLVTFTVAAVALLSLVGLAIDGGSVFAHRRNQQNATDLAALAGANDYLVNQAEGAATIRARTIAASNGFTHGIDGTTVDVVFDTSNGIKVTVDIGSRHHNLIVGVVGMPTWGVGTEAAALAGFPDTAFGAGPFIFSAAAFQTDGTPFFTSPTDFGTGNGDVPNGAQDLAWTNYGAGNVNTNEVREIISGMRTIDKTLQFGQYIGQHNNGNHTSLYDDVNTHLREVDLPVSIVDPNGNFVGWATFHVISANTGSKNIRGYFINSFQNARLTISACAANDCPRYVGSYVLKLVD
jgi:Flp pilus assembly protein TadG